MAQKITKSKVTYRKSKGTPKRCKSCGAFIGNRGNRSVRSNKKWVWGT